MTTRRGKGPEVTLSYLLVVAAGCFANLNDVPQVTVQPSSTVQKLGGTVILGCVVQPPWMNATWRLDGKELNGSDDALGILITRGTLVITALNNRTVGRYQCVARMPAGAVASVPATVTLAMITVDRVQGYVWSEQSPPFPHMAFYLTVMEQHIPNA